MLNKENQYNIAKIEKNCDSIWKEENGIELNRL